MALDLCTEESGVCKKCRDFHPISSAKKTTSRQGPERIEEFLSGAEWLARIIHECRREACETEARRGFSHVRPTQAYWQSVEEAEREKPRRARGSDDG